MPIWMPATIMGASTAPVSISVPSGTTAYTNATDLSTYTSGSLDFGADNAGRLIVAIICSNAASSRTTSSITIGGVAADTVVEANNLGIVTIASAQPTGTTGTVSITYSAAMLGVGIKIIRIDNPPAIAATATATDTTHGTSTSNTGTIDLAAGGVIIAASTTNASVTYTWSDSASNSWTEVQDGTFEASRVFAAAYSALSNAASAATVTATLSGSGSRLVSAWATWG